MKKITSLLLAFVMLASLTIVLNATNSNVVAADEPYDLLDLDRTDALDILIEENPQYRESLKIESNGQNKSIVFDMIPGEENALLIPYTLLRTNKWTDYHKFICNIGNTSTQTMQYSIYTETKRDMVTLYNKSLSIIDNIFCEIALPTDANLMSNIMSLFFVFAEPTTEQTVRLYNIQLAYNQTAETYTPYTNLCLSPSTIQKIQSLADIEDLAKEERAAIALFTVDSNMNILDKDGNIICSIEEAGVYYRRRAIPAFYITEQTIEPVMNYISEKGLSDVFVISDNPELLKRTYNQNSYIGRVLDIQINHQSAELTNEELFDIHKTMNTCMTRTVMLDLKYATKANVRYLESLMNTVWTDASEQTDVGLYKAVTSGVTGIVTSSVQELIKVYESFPKASTLMNPAFVVGHRGIPSRAPENTIEGYLLAIKNGATHVECDVYITTDNYVVISHDSTTNRTGDKNISIENSTLAQVKEVNLKSEFEDYQNLKIPELREFLTAIKPTGASAVIEIKSGKTKVVDETIKIIKELQMEDRCVFISFNADQLKYVAQQYPEFAAGGYLCSVSSSEDYATVADNMAKAVRPLNCTMDTSYGSVHIENIHALLHRGITTWGWTIDDAGTFYSFFTSGMLGITTDNADTAIDMAYDIISQPEQTYIIKDGQITGFDTQLSLKTYGGQLKQAQGSLHIADSGSANLRVENDLPIIDNPGDAYAMMYTQLRLTAGYNYTLYTQPITMHFNLYGDITLDNETNLADVVTLAKIVLDEPTLSSQLQKLSDTDENGSVSLTDVITLAKHVINQ